MMRSLLSSRLLQRSKPPPKASVVISNVRTSNAAQCNPQFCLRNCRCFAQVRDVDSLNRDVYFTSYPPRNNSSPESPRQPDERTLQLGKTVRELHERLPTLLQTPLPSEMLSPNISLHLFPSTHPHLPTVTGRLAYVAALWTAPVAWGRVPLVGNVKLTILSERMVRNGCNGPSSSGDEKLIVKWKTCGKTKARDGTGGIYRGVGASGKDPVEKIKDFIAGTSSSDGSKEAAPEEFTGLFIFEFDEQGRIVKHTIEHTEEGGRWDRMTRVVSVTDWLLGNLSGKRKNEGMPELAWCETPGRFEGRMIHRSRVQ